MKFIMRINEIKSKCIADKDIVFGIIKKVNKKYNKQTKSIGHEIESYFKNTIVVNYKLSNTDTMTKEEFMENFQQYFAKPNPPQIIEEEPEETEIEEEEEEEEPVEEYSFDMLSFISTSPTIRGDNDFDLDHTLPSIKNALQASKKQRGEQIGEILTSLTEEQRV
eukprot:63569_1